MSDLSQLIKLQVYLYKKDSITHDEFANWCKHEYPPKAIPIMKKHNIVHWTETIVEPQLSNILRGALKALDRPQWTVPEYTIIMSYWAKTLDDITGLTTDPEWIDLEKEAQKLSNQELGHMQAGYETVQIDGSQMKSQ